MIIYPLSDITHDQAIWQLQNDGVPFVLVDRHFDGLNAADLLISRIEGKRGPAKRVELPTNLVVRESCGVKLRIKAATSAK